MKKWTLISLLLVALITVFAAMGCDDEGDDGDSGVNAGTPCEQMLESICQAACDCTDSCTWASASTSSSGATSVAECYEFEMAFSTCPGEDMDWDACRAAVDSGTCDASTGYTLPAACDDVGSFSF